MGVGMNGPKQRVVIAGGGGDLGSALCDAFLAEGAEVVSVTRSGSEGRRGVISMRADLSKEGERKRVLGEILERWKGIDTVVWNAGVGRDALVLKTDEAMWLEIFGVNLIAASEWVRFCLPTLMAQRRGSIIVVGSLAGKRPRKGQAIYAASKAGLEAWTKTLAREVGGKGIRVNGVAPGFLESRRISELSPEAQADIRSEIPLGRWGRVNEVAGLVTFLASGRASYITGQTIGMDGGAGM
jgi:3-oxoacyl-[acyl-carrier protein] reductase